MFNLFKKLNAKGEWRKVSELSVGMEIAVPRTGVLENHQAGVLEARDFASLSPSSPFGRGQGEGDVMWDEIVSITHVGQERVYDIEVEGTHNFVGNNIFAHNTYLGGNLGAGYDPSVISGGVAAFNGNVGIGTTAPNKRLTVKNSSNAYDGIGMQGPDWVLSSTGSALYFDLGTTTGDTYSRISALKTGDTAWSNLVLQSGGGNVGIGTTSPQALLDVNGNLPSIILRNTGTNPQNNRPSQLFADGTNRSFDLFSGGDGGGVWDYRFLTGDNTVGSTERVRITSAGNVGIGTTSPLSKLTVKQGSEALGQGFRLEKSNTADNWSWYMDSLNGMRYAFNSSDKITFDQNGSVGIGTTTPQAKLSIAPDASTNIQIGSFLSGYGAIGFQNTFSAANYALAASSAETLINTPSGTAVKFRVNNADKVIIDSGGNVGIGTTSPGAKLVIKDTGNGYVNIGQLAGNSDYAGIAFTNSASSQVSTANYSLLGDGASTYLNTPSNGSIYFRVNNVDKMIMNSSGNVGIGTATPGALLSLQGSSGATANLFNIASSSGASMLYVTPYGGLAINVSSATALNIMDGSSTPSSIFAVDTTQAYANSGIDITAGGGQTGNLLNLFSSNGTTKLAYFSYAGGLVQNISSTTAVSIQNGSGLEVFGIDSFNKNIVIATSASTSIASILAADGDFAIGDDGLTGTTDGRIWLRSRGTTFRFNSTGNSADYSEFFYQYATSSPGDVMAFESSASSPIYDTGAVKLASRPYDPNIAGAITTRGTGYNNADDDRQFNANYANVGLLGHVAVKIASSTAPIKSGDFITSSYEAGRAMKAERSGYVLGVALQDFDPSAAAASASTSSSTIMVLVKPGYQIINNIFALGEEDGQLISATSTRPAATSSFASFLINQKGSGNILQLQAGGFDRFLVATTGSVSILANITCADGAHQEGPLMGTISGCPVLSVYNGTTTLFTINSVGDAAFTGHIIVGRDTAGTATVKAGDNQVEVAFDRPYLTTPKIAATALGLPDFFYGIATKTPAGFIIQMSKPAAVDVAFDWIALEQPQDTTSQSGLNQALVVVSSPTVSAGSITSSPAADSTVSTAPADTGSVLGASSTPAVIDTTASTTAPSDTSTVSPSSSASPAPAVEPAPAPAPAAEPAPADTSTIIQ